MCSRAADLFDRDRRVLDDHVILVAGPEIAVENERALDEYDRTFRRQRVTGDRQVVRASRAGPVLVHLEHPALVRDAVAFWGNPTRLQGLSDRVPQTTIVIESMQRIDESGKIAADTKE